MKNKSKPASAKKKLYAKISEGKAVIVGPADEKVSKKMPVFYNPVMKTNRDISVFLLNSVDDMNMRAALPLAGTGIRGIRFALELKKGKLESISMNDLSENAVNIIKKNIKLNKISEKKAGMELSMKDASLFLLESTGFDYIDIDPFGTPNPFLDSAAKRVSRGGILAVTATDTSALAGTYPEACMRKYWAVPLRNEIQHEAGIRILIRKVQLVGAQFEKALTPIYSYSDQHYMRVFFRCEKSKSKVDEIISQHLMFKEAGPMWAGSLWDSALAARISALAGSRLCRLIAAESKIAGIGFYDIHQICKREKLAIPRSAAVMAALSQEGYLSSPTHFSDTGIRSNAPEKEMPRIIKKALTL